MLDQGRESLEPGLHYTAPPLVPTQAVNERSWLVGGSFLMKLAGGREFSSFYKETFSQFFFEHVVLSVLLQPNLE